MTLFFISFPIAFILYGNKKYWIISEVDFDARDNGIIFFEYLNNNHKDINSIYLIDKRNPGYSTAKKIGKTIKPHSYKHMLVFIAAKAKISTAVHGCSPNSYVTLFLLKHHCTGFNISLKHGITKNLHPNYFKENAHLDLICCGAKPEYEFINSEFKYEEGVAQYTGFARFDRLHYFAPKKEIFIMPTWRRWLDEVNDVNDFINSDYYLNWFNLLNSEFLKKLKAESGCDICFYVHPKLNKYLNKFSTKNDTVKIFNSKDGDSILKHLQEASLLITDFSSVFFDFAYMKKPAIYFQFDENRYYESHYIKAYFDYRQNGFGKVCTKVQDVFDEISYNIENNFIIRKQYLKRCEEYFPLCDSNNCERIYCAILKLLTK